MGFMFIVLCVIVVIMIITVFGPMLGATYKKTYDYIGRETERRCRKKGDRRPDAGDAEGDN